MIVLKQILSVALLAGSLVIAGCSSSSEHASTPVAQVLLPGAASPVAGENGIAIRELPPGVLYPRGDSVSERPNNLGHDLTPLTPMTWYGGVF